MGRHCKRVPLDFEWPINKTYVGYVNPYRGIDCPWCEAGYSPEAIKIKDEVFPHRAGIYHRERHPYYEGTFYCPEAKQHHMTQDEVDYIMANTIHQRERPIVEAFMQKYHPDAEKVTPEIFSHMCLRSREMPIMFPGNLDWELIKYHSAKEGWDSSCPHCGGHGRVYISEEIKKLWEEWERQDPPVGEGYQMWEDTSEGSPLTPVFATAEELAEYCEREKVSWFGYDGASKEEWLELIEGGKMAMKEIAPGVVAM